MERKKYKEFRIKVKDLTKVEVLKPNEIRLSGDVRFKGLEESNINIFCKWLEENVIKTRDEFAVFGSHLFNILFDKEIKETFKDEYDKLRNQPSTGLRVVLEFEPNARDLAVLPWEYLYYPDSIKEGSGFFIGTDSQLILSRHVPLTLKNLKRNPKPLRILIVISTPKNDEDGKGLGIVKADPVIKSIEGLKQVVGESIEIERLNQPTKNSLSEFIKNQKTPFHVVHFIGHGKYEKGREEAGFLGLVDAEDPQKVAWIKDDIIAECFRNREPRLIFLHACKGAHSASYAAFRGVALKLVYSRVPAVVAMQYEITNSVASRFASRFYQSLGEGKDIDLAVQDGREELGLYLDDKENYCSRDFGTPVVYLQTAEGIIIAEGPAMTADSTGEIGDRVPQLLPCPNARDGCTGKVYSTDVKCPTCRHELMLCPNCKKIMSKTKGVCAGCGFEVEDTSEAEKKSDSLRKLKRIQGKETIDRKARISSVPSTGRKPGKLQEPVPVGRPSARSSDR